MTLRRTAGHGGFKNDREMTQDERWQERFNEVKDFIEKNHRNPSRYDDTERGQYLNWIKHNRKQLNAGTLKEERLASFRDLLALMEENKHKNQWI